MTSFTPTRAQQEGENDLGGTHRLTDGFGWSGFASGSERDPQIFHNEARAMGEPAWGIDSETFLEVGGPRELEKMPVAVIKLGFEEEMAPAKFGGTFRLPLPFLSTNSAT